MPYQPSLLTPVSSNILTESSVIILTAYLLNLSDSNLLSPLAWL